MYVTSWRYIMSWHYVMLWCYDVIKINDSYCSTGQFLKTGHVEYIGVLQTPISFRWKELHHENDICMECYYHFYLFMTNRGLMPKSFKVFITYQFELCCLKLPGISWSVTDRKTNVLFTCKLVHGYVFHLQGTSWDRLNMCTVMAGG